jgi:hypothetical protein
MLERNITCVYDVYSLCQVFEHARFPVNCYFSTAASGQKRSFKNSGGEAED